MVKGWCNRKLKILVAFHNGCIIALFQLTVYFYSDVDDTTSCKFELEFVARIFGYKIGQQDYAVLLVSIA